MEVEMPQQWIMVAGPYRSGAPTPAEQHRNLAELNAAAAEIFRKGHVPVIGVNMALPVIDAAGPSSYDEIMLPLSLALAARCDAVLRIGGASAGADQEVGAIRSRGGTLYASLSEIPHAR
jgi:hypothetical protein